MRRRRRTAESDLDEQRPDGRETGAGSGTPPVDVVDTALSVATRSERFRTDQALDLLHDVEAGVSESALRSRIAEIVGSTEAATSDRALVARSELIDTLLDIRLAVCN